MTNLEVNMMKIKSCSTRNEKARLFLLTLIFALIIVTAAGQTQNSQAQTIAEKRYKPELVVQTGHLDGIRSVAYSPDGKYLVTGVFDGTVKLWDIKTGKILNSLSGPTTRYVAAEFSPDGKAAISV